MATFNISITAATVPVANNDSYTVYPNSTTSFSVTDNDFLGATPTVITIEVNPSNGTINIVGMNIDYTPTVGYVGTDSFYYKITDNSGNSDIAKINITIG